MIRLFVILNFFFIILFSIFFLRNYNLNVSPFRISTVLEIMRTTETCNFNIYKFDINNNFKPFLIRTKGVPELFVYKNELNIIDQCLQSHSTYSKRCNGIRSVLGYKRGKSLTTALDSFRMASAEGDKWSENQIPGIIIAINEYSLEEKIFLLDELAKKGNGLAAYILSNSNYFDASNKISKIKYYNSMAISNGEAIAVCQRGVELSTGTITKRDYKNAYLFFKSVSDQLPDALSNMGLMHEMGMGVKLDIPYAVELYKEAYEKGSISGARNLGLAYEHGRSVVQNFDTANNLFEYSSSLGDPIANHKLSKFTAYK